MTEQGFDKFERDAMRRRAEELRAEQTGRSKKNPEADVLERMTEMTEDEAFIASHLHDLIKRIAPVLIPKTWYGMQAYTNPENKVVLFFKAGSLYQSRINTLGFDDAAQIDDGDMYPTSYALMTWNEEIESKIAGLIQKDIGM
ncbi:MAG: hypothetical protein LBM27_01670 [Lactobacillaceae bacterium]|jgi:uncharacterized protein YdhG (YjbR/CyaY superfamily)|nr:hypothetical protein [Lactobacillaceae bacterium]